jgi:hypothetical protein
MATDGPASDEVGHRADANIERPNPMKTRTLRNTGMGMLVLLVGLAVYLQWPDSSSKATGAKAETPVDAAGAKKQAAAVEGRATEPSGGDRLPTAGNSAATGLTPEEKERVAAAMQRFREGLEAIERKYAKVVVDRDRAGKSHVLAIQIAAPDQEELGHASEGLSAQLAQFTQGTPAWKEARRQGEELMRGFNSFKSGYKVLVVIGRENFVEMLTEKSTVEVQEDGSIDLNAPSIKMMNWNQGMKGYGHLFTAEGRPRVGP